MTRGFRPRQILLGILAALVLTALSLAAVVFLGGGTNRGGFGYPAGSRCAAPSFGGPVVSVTLTDMGGPMMGGPAGMRRGGMRLTTDRSTVQHGTVSFLVTNAGAMAHEMVILPLSGNQIAGTRTVGGDGRTDEAGSLGEASATCAAGEGQGILPRAEGWVTVNLPAGRYELICNYPGHYTAGMYGQLTVS